MEHRAKRAFLLSDRVKSRRARRMRRGVPWGFLAPFIAQGKSKSERSVNSGSKAHIVSLRHSCQFDGQIAPLNAHRLWLWSWVRTHVPVHQDGMAQVRRPIGAFRQHRRRFSPLDPDCVDENSHEKNPEHPRHPFYYLS